MLVISANEIKKAISVKEAIEAVAIALREFSSGRAVTPIRTVVSDESMKGSSLFMPALVPSAASLGMKFVSVFPKNKDLGKETIYGVMIHADMETGEPLALLEASYLTVLRTGAASGLATQRLSRANARILGVIGTGAQSKGLIRAIMTVRSIHEIRLYNRTPSKAYELAKGIMDELGSSSPEIIVTLHPDEAVDGADIIVTATNAIEPVFADGGVKKGVHLNAIGSFRPDMQEVPTSILQRAAKVVVESREAALEETGDLIIPIRKGCFRADQIHAELGEIVGGLKTGREYADEITIFKSVGIAAMDVVLAKIIYDRAKQLGLGQQINL